MDDWLKKRLSPVKIDTARWQEFAEAIQEYWEDNFDAHFARYVSLRSIYEANEDDQKWIQRELGKYFEDEIPTTNIPLAVQRREMELCQKETEYPLKNTLARLEMNAEWVPLYASAHAPYGERFLTERDAVSTTRPIDGIWALDGSSALGQRFYLTSRGVVLVYVPNDGDFPGENKLSIIRRRVKQTKPVWIVFHGIWYEIGIECEIEILLSSSYAEVLANRDIWAHPCLRVNGTWSLGVSDLPPALDGLWGLDGSEIIGVVPGHTHEIIHNCWLQRDAEVVADAPMPAGSPLDITWPYFQVTGDPWFDLSSSRRKLDGRWRVTPDGRVDGVWCLDGTMALSGPNLGVMPHYRLGRCGRVGWIAPLLDGSQQVGFQPPLCTTWPYVEMIGGGVGVAPEDTSDTPVTPAPKVFPGFFTCHEAINTSGIAVVEANASVLAGTPDDTLYPYFQVTGDPYFCLSTSPRTLDGGWRVSRTGVRVDGAWDLNGNIRLPSPIPLGAAICRIGTGMRVGLNALPLDGSEQVGIEPSACETWPSVRHN